MNLLDFCDYKSKFIVENMEIMKMKAKVACNLNTQHFNSFHLVSFFLCIRREKECIIESSVLINDFPVSF